MLCGARAAGVAAAAGGWIEVGLPLESRMMKLSAMISVR